MKTLNLMKISRQELTRHWGRDIVSMVAHEEIFIRCNSKGVVNWDKAPVYSWSEVKKEQGKRPVHFKVDPKIFQL